LRECAVSSAKIVSHTVLLALKNTVQDVVFALDDSS
jgi:hypothetical protein